MRVICFNYVEKLYEDPSENVTIFAKDITPLVPIGQDTDEEAIEKFYSFFGGSLNSVISIPSVFNIINDDNVDETIMVNIDHDHETYVKCNNFKYASRDDIDIFFGIISQIFMYPNFIDSNPREDLYYNVIAQLVILERTFKDNPEGLDVAVGFVFLDDENNVLNGYSENEVKNMVEDYEIENDYEERNKFTPHEVETEED